MDGEGACGCETHEYTRKQTNYSVQNLSKSIVLPTYSKTNISTGGHRYCAHTCSSTNCTHSCGSRPCGHCGGYSYYETTKYSYEFEYRSVYNFEYEYEENYIEVESDDPESKQVVYVSENQKKEFEAKNIEIRMDKTADAEVTETIATYNPSSLIGYDYNTSTSKTPYYRLLTVHGRSAMRRLIFPDFKVRENGESTEQFAVRYYLGNNMGNSQDGQSEKKQYLNISSSAQVLLKTLYDIYSQNTYDLDEADVNIDNFDEYKADMDPQTITQESEMPTGGDYQGGVPIYLCLEGNHKQVVQLIELFIQEGILSDSDVGRTASVEDFGIGTQWFLEDDSFITTSEEDDSVASVQCGAGKTVYAPYDGTISTMAENGVKYVVVTSEYFGSSYMSNVNCTKSGSVKKGDVIGKTTGDVEYYRTEGSADGGSEAENVVDELKQQKAKYYADYTWPLPSSGSITSGFGTRVDPVTKGQSVHHGVDIGASAGSDIVSYAPGKVVSVLENDTYGNYIVVKHSNDTYTLYAHMQSFGSYGVGDTVGKGDVIGKVGSTGKSTGPHLHFEVRVGGNDLDHAVNPTSMLGNYVSY